MFRFASSCLPVNHICELAFREPSDIAQAILRISGKGYPLKLRKDFVEWHQAAVRGFSSTTTTLLAVARKIIPNPLPPVCTWICYDATVINPALRRYSTAQGQFLGRTPSNVGPSCTLFIPLPPQRGELRIDAVRIRFKSLLSHLPRFQGVVGCPVNQLRYSPSSIDGMSGR